MLLLSSQQHKIERLLHRVTHIVVWLIGGTILYGGWSLCTDPYLVSTNPAPIKSLENKPIPWSLEDIGKGALSLYPKKKPTLIPDLSKDLMFLAKSSRPDRPASEGNLLFSTRGTSEPIVISQGQQVFLEEDLKKSGESLYHFTTIKTPLWIRPLASSDEEIHVEVGYFSSSKQNESFLEEVTQVLMQQSSSSHGSQQNEPAYLSSLRSGRWWGSDILLKKYGGEDYKSLAEKHKIEIASESGPQYYFCEVEDFLQWDSGSWKEVYLERADPSLPLAKITRIQGKVMEIEAWDENGFYPHHIKIEMQPCAKLSQKNELSISTVRLRSATEVTCKLGKRRLIVKEGDWLLKTAKSWRNLKRVKDIDDCIYHRLQGELFVFDSIEKKQGTVVMKGHLFDDMRTAVLPLSIPILSEDSSRHTLKKNRKPAVTSKKNQQGGPYEE